VEKLVSINLPEGRADFQSFRMRSLSLGELAVGEQDMWLSGVVAQCLTFRGCALKLLQSTRPFGWIHLIGFVTPSEGRGNY
jgi:hypothetical protein